ncbi:MAG: adenylyltransferase/cytidyltransferase family protein [Lachnospiraceae bacterium]|nr:adenylyltransferase/cytidyltransferase family protein [Lachnospiraceae bacterium]
MKKYKIGYTTGVYDMFHVGHLNILRHAKEQCDYLIVGVSTDECVQTYKHKTPVIPFEDRKAIVSAIRYVDEVVPQETMDKYAAWEKLHFDAIFHGDDWKGSTMYNEIEDKLKKHGVEFVYIPYTKGISSSKLREELKDSSVPNSNDSIRSLREVEIHKNNN